MKNETAPDSLLEELVRHAQAGDADAMEAVVRAIQDRVYHLSLRMLVDPSDAEAATQEIMILVVTHLSTFEGRSAFTTWVFTLARRYLLRTVERRRREHRLTFEEFAADLESGLIDTPSRSPDDQILLDELRLACTLALLLCLDGDQRLAYVLGDVLQLDHTEASAVLELPPATYRKRLSRARAKVVEHTRAHCGLVSDSARCRCPRRLPAAHALGRIRAGTYTRPDGPTYDDVVARAREVESHLRTLTVQTATPDWKSPVDFAARIAAAVDPEL